MAVITVVVVRLHRSDGDSERFGSGRRTRRLPGRRWGRALRLVSLMLVSGSGADPVVARFRTGCRMVAVP